MNNNTSHYNIVFSVPIHERLEVVVDQVLNFMHFNPDCAIVFHISQGFNYKDSLLSKEMFLRIIEKLDGVFINPTSVRTGLGDIIQAHLSNFDYISSVANFDFFAICSSNESFVKPGLYNYLTSFDCGVEQHLDVTDFEGNKCFAQDLQNDKFVKLLLMDLNYDRIIGSHIEGQFYKKELFSLMKSLIERHFDYTKVTTFYPREEYFFSTVIASMQSKGKNLNIGALFTYSAYHYDHLFNANPFEINRVIKKGGNLFTVKRVDRKLDDEIRAYLRQNNSYLELEKEITGLNIEHIKTISIYYRSIKKIVKVLFAKRNVVVRRIRKCLN